MSNLANDLGGSTKSSLKLFVDVLVLINCIAVFLQRYKHRVWKMQQSLAMPFYILAFYLQIQ